MCSIECSLEYEFFAVGPIQSTENKQVKMYTTTSTTFDNAPPFKIQTSV